VVPGMDEGPIIAQAAVAVHDDDNAETLAARVLEEEHIVYPEALRVVASGAYTIDGNRVRSKLPGMLAPSCRIGARD
jgi:phosphoribosylglycinamide formyltransferase-1